MIGRKWISSGFIFLLACLVGTAISMVRVAAAVRNYPTYSYNEHVRAPLANARTLAHMGRSVAAAGNHFAVGAHSDGPLVNALLAPEGVVFAYHLVSNGSAWVHQFDQRITSPSPVSGGLFGYSVAMTDSTLVVGAPGENKVYIYSRSGDIWTLHTTLSAPGGGPGNFGCSVSIENDLLAVGAVGSIVSLSAGVNFDPLDLSGLGLSLGKEGRAYAYRRAAGVWSLEDTLRSYHTVDIALGPNAGTYLTADSFGYSVAAQSTLGGVERIIVGAPTTGSLGVTANAGPAVIGAMALNEGAAWIFTRTGGGWNNFNSTVKPTLVRGNIRLPLNLFGNAVAINGNTAVVGSRFNLAYGLALFGAGAVTIFTHNGTSWSLQDEFGSGTNFLIDNTLENFGASVALNGDALFVGAPNSLTGGKICYFTRSAGVWTKRQNLTIPTDALLGLLPLSGDALGTSVAATGTVVIGGAMGRDSWGLLNSGAAFTFQNDSLAPVVQADKTVTTAMNTGVSLGITAPANATDQNFTLTATVTAIPTAAQGTIRLGAGGTVLAVGDTLTPAQVATAYFQPATNFLGNAGAFAYTVSDNFGAYASQTITLRVVAVPVAPSNLTVTTPAAPTGLTQLNLSWTQVADATGYLLYRSTNPAGPFTTVVGTVNSGTTTTFSDTSLSNGTTYYYRVAGTNVAGTGPQSATANGTTLSAAPTGLTVATPAAPAGLTQLNLSWTASPGATGYLVYRSTTPAGPFTTSVATINSGSTTTYQDMGRANGTTYYYQVAATNAGGTGPNSSTANGTTLSVAPTGLMVTTPAAPAGQTGLNVSWNQVTGATGYTLYRSTNPAGPFTTSVATINSGATTTFADSGLTPGTSYYYQVAANTTNGATANSATASGTTLLPAPGNVAVTTPAAPIGQTGLNVSWDVVPGAAGYEVYRSLNPAGPFTTPVGTINSGATNSFADSGLTPGTTYYYQVATKNAGGTGSKSASVPGTTLAVAPGNVTVSTPAAPAGETTLNVNWDVAPNATGYSIYRSENPAGPFTTLAGTVNSGNTTTFQDSGLTAGTTYYYQVASNNTAGVGAHSPTADGTTLAAAPTGLTVTTPAPNAGLTELDLSWNPSTGATGYLVYRSTNPAGPFTTVAGTINSGATTTFADTGRAPNTTYYYQVAATNAGGTGSHSVTANGTTLAAAPSGLTVTTPAAPDGQSELNVSWNAVAGATGYRVYRSPQGANTFVQIGVINSGATVTFADGGLASNTTYDYRVATVNAGGVGPQSATASGTTLITPLPVPTGVVVTTPAAPAGASSLQVDWNAVPGATSYEIFRSTNPAGPFTTSAGTTTNNTFSDSGLTAGTQYYYVVVATNGISQSASATASGTTLAVAPTGLTVTTPATPSGLTELDLSWSPSTGATGYLVYRSTNPAGPFTTVVGTINSGATTTFADTGVSPNTTYYYEVAATNAGGIGVHSATENGTTLAAAPSGLTVTTPPTPDGQSKLNLSWNMVTGATGYRVYRSPQGANTFVEIGSINSGATTTFGDAGLSASTTYDYRVAAVNAGGVGPQSATASGTTLATPLAAPTGVAVTTPAAPAGETSLQIDWNPVLGATGYEVFRSTNPAGPFTTSVGTTSTTTTLTDSGLTPGTTYYYIVVATNGTDQAASTPAASGTTQAAAPTGLTATTPAYPTGLTQINLSWNASTGATGYEIFRSPTGAMGSFTSVGTVSSGATTTFQNTGLTPNTTYYYQVAATNAGGTGSHSATASSTTLAPAPTGLLVTTPAAPTGQTQLNVTWDAVPGATSYVVTRLGPDGITTRTVMPGMGGTVTFADTGLTPGEQYTYSVATVNAGGAGPNSPSVSGNTLAALAAPSGVTVTTPAGVPGQTRLNISWSPVIGAAGYSVYRSTNPAGPFTTLVGTTTGATVTLQDPNLAPDTRYYYVVIATDGAGEGPASSPANGKTSALPAALGLSVATPADPDGRTKLNLSWNDQTGGTASYVIQRSGPSSSTFTTVGTVGAGVSTFQDTGLANDTTYTYRVMASLNGSEGPASATATGHTLALPSPDPSPVITNIRVPYSSKTSAQITWTTNIPTTCTLQYRLGGEVRGTATATTSDSLNHMAQLDNLAPNNTYTYMIYAMSTVYGTQATSPEQTFITPANLGFANMGAAVSRDTVTNQLIVTLTVFNGTASALTNVRITACSITTGSGKTSSSAVPATLGTILPNAQASQQFFFPASVGVRGAMAVIGGQFTSNSQQGSASLRTTLP